MSQDESPPPKKPGKKRKPDPTPIWDRQGNGASAAIRYLPGEKVARKEVDMDLQFRRAQQFVDWLMDRMEAEINGSELFTGVPAGFAGHVRELSSAMNTLSLAHARWLKANEELYERLSDDEKLAALGDWIPALYLRHPEIVTKWMKDVAQRIVDTSKSRGNGKGPVMQSPVIEEVTGAIRRPTWTEVSAKVREDFKKKRDAAYGPPRKEPTESAAQKIWAMRNKAPAPEEPDES